MKRALMILTLTLALAIAACGRDKPAESTYGSTDTIPTRTDTTMTSTAGPGAEPVLSVTDTTNTRYGGTSVTDTGTTARP